MDENEEERSRPADQSPLAKTIGRNGTLSVASPSRLGAGYGGDGGMGRGVQNIAQGEEVIGEQTFSFP